MLELNNVGFSPSFVFTLIWGIHIIMKINNNGHACSGCTKYINIIINENKSMKQWGFV